MVFGDMFIIVIGYRFVQPVAGVQMEVERCGGHRLSVSLC